MFNLLICNGDRTGQRSREKIRRKETKPKTTWCVYQQTDWWCWTINYIIISSERCCKIDKSSNRESVYINTINVIPKVIYGKEKPSRKGVNHHICVLGLILQWFCGEWFGVTRGSGLVSLPKSRRDKEGGPKLEKGWREEERKWRAT